MTEHERVNKALEDLGLDRAAIARAMDLGFEKSSYPVVYDKTEPFAPGLHLLHGRRGRGKTANLVALQTELILQGNLVRYKAMNEPRAPQLIESRALSPEEKRALGGTYAGTYNDWYLGELAQLQEIGAGMTKVPVLIIDGIHFTLASLALTVSAMENESDVTYKEGINIRTFLGCLHHSMLAARCGVAVLGVVNEDIMPIADRFDAATEGIISITSLGRFTERSRQTARMGITRTIENQYIEAAFTILGYDWNGGVQDDPGRLPSL